MILNNPKYVHTVIAGSTKPQDALPKVDGFFKKEETSRPDRPERIDLVRTTTFVPGVRLLGYLLLLLGGFTLVKPADGDSPARIRGSAAAFAALGLTLILWRREMRQDLIVIEHT